MNEIIKKNGITFGIIIGLFSILVTTSIYSIDLNLFISPTIGITSMLVHLIIGIVLITKTKKQMNSIISFKEVFSTYFLAGIIGSFTSTLYNILLFNFIDPEAKTKIKELTIKYTMNMMEKFGSTKEILNETLKKLNETDNFSTGNLISGMFMAFIFIAILGLILAAIFKSKPSQGL